MTDPSQLLDHFVINWDKITTVALAAWGAILSTIIFLKDKPKIEVGLRRGFTVNFPEQVDTLSLTVANSGRRPLVIESVQFSTSSNESLFIFPNDYFQYDLPKKLDENEQITVIAQMDTIRNACVDKNIDLNDLVFIDSLGRKYKKHLKWRYWSDLKWSRFSQLRKNLAASIFPKNE